MGANRFAQARVLLYPVVLFGAVCAAWWRADAVAGWLIGGAILCAALAAWEAVSGATLWLPARGELALIVGAGLVLAGCGHEPAFAASAVLVVLFCMDSRCHRLPAGLVLLAAGLSAAVAAGSTRMSPEIVNRLMDQGGAGGMLVLAGTWGASVALFGRRKHWAAVSAVLPALAFLTAAASLQLPLTTAVTVSVASMVLVGLARTPRLVRRHWLLIMFMLGLCAMGAVTGLTMARVSKALPQAPAWHVPYWLETAAAVVFFPACLYGLARKVWRAMHPGWVVHAGCLAATAGFAVAALQGGFLTNPVAVACAFLAATGAAWWEAPMARSRGLHVRLDYGPVSCDLLGFGMRRLVAVGFTLSLPHWGRRVAHLLVALCAAGLAWWFIAARQIG